MKSILTMFEKAAMLVRFPLPSGAFLPWPSFSLASYAITARLASEGIAPKTVIDVGANKGQFTVACMKRFARPRVHAFEPLPEAFHALVAATKKFAEVSSYNTAIGERNGSVPFHVGSDIQSSSIFSQNRELGDSFPGVAVTRTVDIEMRTLDTSLQGADLHSPVLLKLDVQGYEAKVIEGARGVLELVDFVVAETSFAPLYEGESTFLTLVELLQGRGFDFRRPVGMLISPVTGAFLQIDALFCRSHCNQQKTCE